MQVAGCNPVPNYMPGWDVEELLALNDIAGGSLLPEDLVRRPDAVTVPLAKPNTSHDVTTGVAKLLSCTILLSKSPQPAKKRALP